MVCDDCPLRTECPILNQYLQNEAFIKEGNEGKLRELYDMLELHESYLTEMRRDILKKINKMRTR
jgi:hypothetical protein